MDKIQEALKKLADAEKDSKRARAEAKKNPNNPAVQQAAYEAMRRETNAQQEYDWLCDQ